MEEVTAKSNGHVQDADRRKWGPTKLDGSQETAFGSPRDFLDNRYVYVVVSARARGLSVGINMNPDKYCNFRCIYCEVQRGSEVPQVLDVDVMEEELRRTLAYVKAGRLRERPWYRNLPEDVLQLRHVAISGDGEPTLSPRFTEAHQAVIHVRALSDSPFFKVVLITNGTGLDLPNVQQGMKFLTRNDEVWAKLDGGSQAYIEKVNRPEVPFHRVLENIVNYSRVHPIVIQSLFPSINGEEPAMEEIEDYARRLTDLKRAGAQISLVQIYSATRPASNPDSGHLPLKVLSRIAQIVRKTTGLKAEVF